jgi:hypothetical protein
LVVGAEDTVDAVGEAAVGVGVVSGHAHEANPELLPHVRTPLHAASLQQYHPLSAVHC